MKNTSIALACGFLTTFALSPTSAQTPQSIGDTSIKPNAKNYSPIELNTVDLEQRKTKIKMRDGTQKHFQTKILAPNEKYIEVGNIQKSGIVEALIHLKPYVSDQFLNSTAITIDGAIIGFDRPKNVLDKSYRVLALGGNHLSGDAPVSIVKTISEVFIPKAVKELTLEEQADIVSRIGAYTSSETTILISIDYDNGDWWFGKKDSIPVEAYNLLFDDSIDETENVSVQVVSGIGGETLIRAITIQ